MTAPEQVLSSACRQEEHAACSDTAHDRRHCGCLCHNGPADPEPIVVRSLSWKTSKPQVWHDSWRQKDRVCRFQGACVVCNRRTYAFDDGENDPRGVLGDRAASPLVAEEHERRGPTVPLCFPCANTEGTYLMADRIATRKWDLYEQEHPLTGSAAGCPVCFSDDTEHVPGEGCSYLPGDLP